MKTVPASPRVSVLVPAFNEERRIGRCLASVHAAFRHIGSPAYEVVVCDNNSADRTAAIARENGARVTFEPVNQIARARNTAAREAKGEWLLFLDADSRLSGPLLEATIQRMDGGKVGAGGALVAFETEHLRWDGRFGISVWNCISATFQVAAGTYIFCERRIWEASGGFDERFYAGEEVYLTKMLKRACRSRGRRFEIIRSPRVQTSARKVDTHSPRQLFATVFRLMWPGALRQKEACGFWYSREEESDR